MVKTRIVYDKEYDEYIVKLYIDGVYLPDADYHTSDKVDAQLTAAVMRMRAKEKLYEPKSK